MRNGTDVPADLGQGVDHTGGEHVLDVGLIVLPAGELERQPRGGQLLEHEGAVRGVAGVFAAPKGAGGGERLEMREVVDQAVQHRKDLVPAVQSDVDVDAVDDHLPAPPLRPVDELRVAFLISHGLQLGRAERMAPGAEDLHAHGVGDLADRGQRTVQVGFRLRHGGADSGDEFHGVQQQLLLDVRVLVVLVEFGMPGSDSAEHLVRHGGQLAGLGVDERQLPFHAKSRLPG
jgi:hypothetical protein